MNEKNEVGHSMQTPKDKIQPSLQVPTSPNIAQHQSDNTLKVPLIPVPEYQRYSVKFDIDDLDEEDVEATHYTKQQWAMIAVGTVVVCVLLYFLYDAVGADVFRVVLHTLRKIVKSDNIFSYILLILFQFVFGWILFMPGLSTFNILQAYLMQSFWKSFFLTTLGSYLASLSIFWIIKKYFRQQIIEKFRKKILFRIVYLEVKKNPWKMGIMFNLLFIPASVKNYLMALTSITLFQFGVCVLPVHTMFCGMFAFVGYSITDLNAIFHDKPWHEKTGAEKFQKIMTYALLLFTCGLMVAFFLLAKKKYAEIEQEHKNESLMARSRLKEMDQIRIEPNTTPQKPV